MGFPVKVNVNLSFIKTVNIFLNLNIQNIKLKSDLAHIRVP